MQELRAIARAHFLDKSKELDVEFDYLSDNGFKL